MHTTYTLTSDQASRDLIQEFEKGRGRGWGLCYPPVSYSHIVDLHIIKPPRYYSQCVRFEGHLSQEWPEAAGIKVQGLYGGTYQ